VKIAEIFRSRQGEGLLTGTESVFVRTSGCNLRCCFCDTPYTSWSPEGVDLSVEEILARVGEHDTPHVVITGGEPMLFAESIPLCHRLRRIGRHVTIETAGTLHLPVECDLMSISPKFESSAPPAKQHPHWHRRHERERHRPDVIRRLIAEFEYQVKFVIDSGDDIDRVREYLAEFSEINRERVLLMPQGADQEQLEARSIWLKPFCDAEGFTFCPRKQIEWFGPVRGT
jgi:7-carboxy-7-deazaguanine synthase